MALKDRARKVSSSCRLEVGHQYTTEELTFEDSVVFTDVDYVSYVDKVTGEDVCYSVWEVKAAKNAHWDNIPEHDGYYRGGTALTELYQELFADPENPECAENLEELRNKGFEVSLESVKTKAGQRFVKVIIP